MYHMNKTKHEIFGHFINQWNQLKGKWNWYTATLLLVEFENDIWTGGAEFTFIILGLGFRVRWNYNFEGSEVGKHVMSMDTQKFIKKIESMTKTKKSKRVNKTKTKTKKVVKK